MAAFNELLTSEAGVSEEFVGCALVGDEQRVRPAWECEIIMLFSSEGKQRASPCVRPPIVARHPTCLSADPLACYPETA